MGLYLGGILLMSTAQKIARLRGKHISKVTTCFQSSHVAKEFGGLGRWLAVGLRKKKRPANTERLPELSHSGFGKRAEDAYSDKGVSRSSSIPNDVVLWKFKEAVQRGWSRNQQSCYEILAKQIFTPNADKRCREDGK
jgi:hypothetical protein